MADSDDEHTSPKNPDNRIGLERQAADKAHEAQIAANPPEGPDGQPLHKPSGMTRVVRDRNRVSGGGVTAGIDFGLTLAAELAGEEIAQLMDGGKIDRPDVPAGPSLVQPVRGSAIPKAGKRFAGAEA